ncbi:VNG_1110C family protein [Natronomonas sp. EA1]|uniref:VNG_1110C family protein n=1 Tax=Natronomonas sp. EA1 TaxID=3421655 RepID=UPI003EBC112F
MPDPTSLRDSTQIVLPAGALEGLRADIEERFLVTVFEVEGYARIIGSPVVIKEVSDFLARHGVSLP